MLILGIVFLVITLQTLQLDEGSAGYFVHLGFGAINQYAQGRLGLKTSMYFTYLRFAFMKLMPTTESWAPGLYSDILLANIWQFLVSMLYVQYNPLLSCMLANREWHRYAAGTNERKPLRVSSPVGFQRSSYYISMPWRYGIPLLVTMAILHWILSQSVFVLPIETVRSDGTVDTNNHFSTVGFSIWPMISGKLMTLMIFLLPLLYYYLTVLIKSLFGLAMLVGLLLMSAVIICGLQRYQGGMPMGATCSAVISAACHQPLPHDKDAYRFPVQWGAVSHPSLDFQSEARTNGGVDESDLIRVRGHESRGRGSTSREQGNGLQAQLEPGHCCFTTARDAEPPRVGEFYA